MPLSPDQFFGQVEQTAPTSGKTAGMSPEQFFGEPSGMDKALTTVKKTASNVAGVADMVLSVPGMLAGVGADIASRAIGTVAGEPRRDVAQAGVKAGEQVSSALGSPIGKLMRYFGYGDTYDQSDVNNVMQTFNHWIGKGGDWVEAKTSGALLKEDVQSLANTAMAAVAGKGLEAGGKAIAKSLDRPKPVKTPPAMTPDIAEAAQGIDPQAKAKLDSALKDMTVANKKQVKEIFANAKKPLPENALDEQFVKSLWERTIKGVQEPAPETAAAVGKDVSQIGTAGHEIPPDLEAQWDKELSQSIIDQGGKADPKLLAGIAAAGGVSAYLAANPDKLKEISTLAMAVGAVRGVGEGVWTKGAARKLANPLADKFVDWQNMSAPPHPAESWAPKAITRHLNKYFGSDLDPLNSVKIPMLGDEVTWGDVADKVVKSAKIPVRLDMIKKGEAMKGEPIWDVETGYGQIRGINHQLEDYLAEGDHYAALSSYLSHVGDYLREFVPPEKLGQYDLVRAVKETAKQDEVQAAKMAKARAEGAGTVPVKTYPDGMNWVEVGKGADQAVNEAALKNEGDIMGHCVGGYCEAVHSGESRIFSLRDAKGMSHVTVEVAPAGSYERSPYRNIPEGDPRTAASILQIKGKQNRAPVPAYLPYVQDFVKNPLDGKAWGDVGDLQNTGLRKIDPDLAKYGGKLQGQQYATDAELTEAIRTGDYQPKPPVNQRGSVDPKLLAKMAAIGTGAVVGALATDDSTKGAILGGLAGGLAARFGGQASTALWDASKVALTGHPWQAVKELVPGPISKAFADDPRVRIKSEMDKNEVSIRRDALERSRLVLGVIADVPKAERRNAISHFLEGDPSVSLSGKERAAAMRVQAYFNKVGAAGKDAGVISDLISNYVTHVYGKDALPFIDELMKQRVLGSTSTPYGKARVGPPTINEVNTFMASKGRPPIMTDIAEIVEQYGKSVSKAMANKILLEELRVRTTPVERNGQKTMQPLVASAIPGKAPANYVPFGKQGLVAHPDIVASLRFAFENESPLLAVRAIEAVNTAAKRSAVSFSLFHAKNLIDAFAGASTLSKKNIAGGAAIGAVYGATQDDPITYAMIGAGLGMAAGGLKIAGQAISPKLFGENRYVKALRENDPALAKMIDLSMEGGLMYSLKRGDLAERELGQDFYSSMKWLQQQADKTIPGTGAVVKGITEINHAVDGFMWERLHTGMKLEIFAQKYEILLRNNAKAHAIDSKIPLFTEKEIAERAASFTNDIFGGLNWRRVAEESKTRWGRDMAMSSYSPAGQRILRLGMFAPDWTISTTRAALKAFGPAVGQEAGTGIKGLLNPRTVTDLHRQYMIRSALYYVMIGDGLNYAMSGHHLWQNKDPTYLETGDGQKIQFSKHTMEPYHWLQHPVQQALSKLGQGPKELANQALGTDYLSPRKTKQGQVIAGPAMPGSRLGHALNTISPIGVQQVVGGGANAGAMGALGMPVYGHTKAQLRALKREAEARKRRHEE